MGCCGPVVPLCIVIGANLYEPINYFQDDGETPVDLTGYTARMKIKSSFESSEDLLDLTTENGGILILDVDAAPQLAINILAAQTADLIAGTAVGNLFLIAPDDSVESFLEFQFTITPSTNA